MREESIIIDKRDVNNTRATEKYVIRHPSPSGLFPDLKR